jgi:DNA-binding transcriptional LysR family regulator
MHFMHRLFFVHLRSLSHFVTVADTLNFRIAAERLHMSQPALTRSIATLEKSLGVKLFDRDTRGVALTSEGAQLLERARGLVAAGDEFSYSARALSAASPQQLRVGIYGNGLAELTHPVLAAFAQQYPETSLQIRDADFARGIEPLLAGEMDIAFLRAPENLPALHITPLFSEPLDLVVWEGHPLATRSSAYVREIFGDSWVTFPPSIPSRWGEFWLFENERLGGKPNVGAFARSELELLTAIAYRRLSGVLPTSGLRLSPHPGVKAVRAKDSVASVASVAYPSSGFNPAAAALARVASEVVQANLHLVAEASSPY